jgi:hypothetical protein
MEDRCAGSLRHPLTTAAGVPPRPAQLRETREQAPVPLGVCAVCGAWLRVLANGTLPVHVNWPQRQARRLRPVS